MGTGYCSLQQVQNFRTISPKLYKLGHKKTGTWGVNRPITVVIKHIGAETACSVTYSRGGFRGGGTRPGPPIFTCKIYFRAQYLPLCQYLLKNQFLYISQVSTVCVCNCYQPSTRSLCVCPPPPPPLLKYS